jgi:hypothetical protein
MATKRKTGTLGGTARTVKRVAKTVTRTTNEYAVEPAEKALGMKGKKRPARSKTAAHKKASTGRAAKSRSGKRAAKSKSR